MNKQKLTKVAILLMIVFSFSGFFLLLGKNTNLASITLIIGIVCYFITSETKEREDMSLKMIPDLLKDAKLDILILMPILMNVICYAFAKMFLPEFLEHLLERIGFLSFNQIIVLIIELMIAALGEEIAWRGFFQNRLSKWLPFSLALFITAGLFSFCHFSIGSLHIVLYDFIFIIINAIFYGLIYKKSNNIIICTISHFFANVVGILGLFLII